MTWLRRRPWAPPLIWAGLILIATTVPVPAVPGAPDNTDKFVHCFMYFVLGALSLRAFFEKSENREQ